jgi:hypothetical protein
LISYVYRQKATPERPQQFDIVDRGKIEICPSGHPPIKGIDLTCGTLFKTLSDFDMDVTFFYRQVMSSAITEYIFKPKVIAQRSASFKHFSNYNAGKREGTQKLDISLFFLC